MFRKKPGWLFHVGAQKAGSTWLYRYFSDHPEVYVPAVKELHYFNTLWLPDREDFIAGRERAFEARRGDLPEPPGAFERLRALATGGQRSTAFRRRGKAQPGDVATVEALRDLVQMHHSKGANDHADYRRFMCKGVTREKITVDMTPDYGMLSAGNFAEMAESFPESKFLFVMRDPVDRTWSHLRMHFERLSQRGVGPKTLDGLMERLLAGGHGHITVRSRYDTTVAALDAAVPRDRVLFLFYERLFDDETIRELCDFLGIGFRPGDYGARVREGRKTAIMPEQYAKLRNWLEPVYAKIGERFGDKVPESWGVAPEAAALAGAGGHV